MKRYKCLVEPRCGELVTDREWKLDEMLLDFERPPVSEVVIGVQFGTTLFSNIHAGMFYERMKKRYPKVSEQDPLAATFETFGLKPVQPPTFQFTTGRIPTRYWFVAENNCELIQVQNDRFLHNWRQTQSTEKYPRFRRLFSEFSLELEAWQRFLQEQNIGDLHLNQCEVTYINHIFTPDGSEPFGQLGKIFKFWNENIHLDGALPLENVSGALRFLLNDGSGVPYGRLHAEIIPAVHNETQKSVIQFQLTARAKPQQETIVSAKEAIERCHLAVIQSFAALTTNEMHAFWGLKNVSDK